MVSVLARNYFEEDEQEQEQEQESRVPGVRSSDVAVQDIVFLIGSIPLIPLLN